MDKKTRRLMFEAIDETISQEDFERLQDELERDPELRRAYLCTVGLTESLTEIATQVPPVDSQSPVAEAESRQPSSSFTWWQWSVAASVLLLVGTAAYWIGRQAVPNASSSVTEAEESLEALIAGHATLRSVTDIEWSSDSSTFREGEILPGGRLSFLTGVVEIDFFCGATVIIEGPADFKVESDWSLRVDEGRLRANVPPAARGFIVRAAGSEIVDLGTEFALEVGASDARIEVLDGEVELRGGSHDGVHLKTGQRQWLTGADGPPNAVERLSTVEDLQRRREDAASLRFAAWQRNSLRRAGDARLIAYFPVSGGLRERLLANAAVSGAKLDGKLIGPVSRTAGRFGRQSQAVRFDRPGARIRSLLDGTFEAFTFTCWVRIDSLQHVYNALFMADGYENGEPHWQIRDDGRMMFSVMVDDSQNVRVTNRFDKRVVKDAGLHRVYFTEPFWDITQSGRWFHLAAVYDPAARRVAQFVNGKLKSDQQILDKFYIPSLRIGPGEIGNWGQPFRRTPWFAVRNLDGAIDELAIYNAALDDAEILKLYEQGRPLGY